LAQDGDEGFMQLTRHWRIQRDPQHGGCDRGRQEVEERM
jgi:hypothetical protein